MDGTFLVVILILGICCCCSISLMAGGAYFATEKPTDEKPDDKADDKADDKDNKIVNGEIGAPCKTGDICNSGAECKFGICFEKCEARGSCKANTVPRKNNFYCDYDKCTPSEPSEPKPSEPAGASVPMPVDDTVDDSVSAIKPVSGERRSEVYFNNGTVSCNTYCAGTSGGPWNNELPADWNGAKCVSTNLDGVDCNTTPGLRSGFVCICEKTGTGWAGKAPAPGPVSKNLKGCESQPPTLTCENGKTIKSGSFRYGRWDNTACPHPTVTPATAPVDAAFVLPSKCIGQATCALGPLNTEFQDIYPNVYKQYEASWTCN